MWSWHWSPLMTTLDNGVKVVEKVITSKFGFHLIAIYALGCFRNFSCTPITVPKLPWRAPTPVRLVKEWILMLLIKKNQLTWKLFIYWYLMSFFFIKKMSQNLWATIMPFGPVTNILLALISGTACQFYQFVCVCVSYQYQFLINSITWIISLCLRVVAGIAHKVFRFIFRKNWHFFLQEY